VTIARTCWTRALASSTICGWSLEAAEAVCSDEQIAPEYILDLVALVSKSLVLADEDADGTERYRMLETVGQYARH
jgi:predicted ATPase